MYWPMSRAGAGIERHGLRPELLLGRQDLAGDLVKRLVPADGLPLVLAAVLPRALQRMQDAVGRIDDFRQVEAADAQTALVERVLRIALDLDEPPLVVGVHENAASEVAPRCRPCAPPRHMQAVFVELVRLLMIDERVFPFLRHECSFLALGHLPALGVAFGATAISTARLPQPLHRLATPGSSPLGAALHMGGCAHVGHRTYLSGRIG